MPVYRLTVEERRPTPVKDYPERTTDYELLDIEVTLQAFDFRRLLNLLMDMMPEQKKAGE